MGLDIVVITALLAFILGLIVGVIITRPVHYR